MNKSQIIKESLKDAGEHYAKLHSASGLKCPEGCGKCCFNPNVFCRPSELLPLAQEFIRRGEAENMLEKVNQLLSQSSVDQTCILLNIQNSAEYKGSCSMYEFRPLLCRSFGVFLRNDKEGNREFSLCREYKDLYAKEIVDLEKNISAFDDYPSVDKIAYAFYNGEGDLFYESEVQINQALKISLEKALFQDSFLKENT